MGFGGPDLWTVRQGLLFGPPGLIIGFRPQSMRIQYSRNQKVGNPLASILKSNV